MLSVNNLCKEFFIYEEYEEFTKHQWIINNG